MKMRLRNNNPADNTYNILNNKEEIVGTAEPSYDNQYWLVSIGDNHFKFEKVSQIARYLNEG
jgi:hypothetical protein